MRTMVPLFVCALFWAAPTLATTERSTKVEAGVREDRPGSVALDSPSMSLDTERTTDVGGDTPISSLESNADAKELVPSQIETSGEPSSPASGADFARSWALDLHRLGTIDDLVGSQPPSLTRTGHRNAAAIAGVRSRLEEDFKRRGQQWIKEAFDKLEADGTNIEALAQLTREPVIIGGCGRSGTTLLNSILSAHPNIAAIHPETYAFCPTAYHPKVDLKAPLEPAKALDALARQKLPAAARRWSEKSPKNILYFGRILDYFHRRVKLIQLVRDGRDVVTSMHPDRPGRFYVSPERWIAEVAAGARFLGDPRVLTLRYEDLVLDSAAAWERIFRFIGEPLAPELFDYPRSATLQTDRAWFGPAKNIHADSIGRWREHPGEGSPVRHLLEDPEGSRLLRLYGYR